MNLMLSCSNDIDKIGLDPVIGQKDLMDEKN